MGATYDLRAHFRKFLEAQPERLHFAAHSHHLWPDVTFEAQQQAWLDAARFADDKWDHVFADVLPEAQRHVASELGLPASSSVVFATNTHELVVRLLSCLGDRPTIVTTDSEFHSFERQTRRLEEDALVRVVRVPSEPFASLPARLAEAVTRHAPQLLFVSHVFFNSGAVLQGLEALLAQVPRDTHVVVDGYHGFLAVPERFTALASRAFYVSGGYKYAMAGEGACFMHVPAGLELRPRNTGWFAAFGALAQKVAGQVPYAPDAAQFMGATFDPTALYRFNAVMRWRAALGVTTAGTREHAHTLQRQFIEGLAHTKSTLRETPLVVPLSDEARGQFITFRTDAAQAISTQLKAKHVVTDARADRLRFGFGLYQTPADVDALLERL